MSTMNGGFEINITYTRNQHTYHFRRTDESWVETEPSGAVLNITAERVLYHLLRALARKNSTVAVSEHA